MLAAILAWVCASRGEEEGDQECSPGFQCVGRRSCPKFVRDYAAYSRLPPGTQQRKESLAALQGTVCNSQYSRVCCRIVLTGSCPGEEDDCVPEDFCPGFLTDLEQLGREVLHSDSTCTTTTDRLARLKAGLPLIPTIWTLFRIRYFCKMYRFCSYFRGIS